MMGRTHALTGALAGLLVGRVIGLDTVPEIGPFATTVAGYALLPDLDHPKAAASRLLGPITGALSRLLRGVSAWLYARTKGPRDEPSGKHRHLTHTLVFALFLGGVCAVSTAYGGPWTVAGWLLFGVLLAADRLGKIAIVAFGVGLAAWLAPTVRAEIPFIQALSEALDISAGWLGLAVGLGCFVHCLGDAMTESGCPFLWLIWPWPIKGETWYEIRPPRWLRFRTGKRVENLLIFPAVALACVAAVPGVLPHLIDIISRSAPVAGG